MSILHGTNLTVVVETIILDIIKKEIMLK